MDEVHDPKREFIPAAGVDWLLPLYDPLLRLLGRDALLRRTVLADADLRPGQRLLDIGCGTGILSVLLKQAEPNAEVSRRPTAFGNMSHYRARRAAADTPESSPA